MSASKSLRARHGESARGRAATLPSAPRSTKPADLAKLQAWMQHEVVRVVEQRASKAPAAKHVLPSRTLAPHERVDIYTTMYRLRMMEALETDYPALHAHLGCERFETLMLAYLRAHPSRHYSLNFLGYALPAYLAREAKAPHPKERAFLADVALVEHLITEVFDDPESEKLEPKTLATLPPEAFAKARLELVPALRLVELAHDANKAVTALRHKKPAPSTKPQRAWVVVYRKDHVVWRMDLDEAAFHVLKALQAKRTLPKAIAAGAERFRGTPETFQAKLQAWFAEWASEGFFRALVR